MGDASGARGGAWRGAPPAHGGGTGRPRPAAPVGREPGEGPLLSAFLGRYSPANPAPWPAGPHDGGKKHREQPATPAPGGGEYKPDGDYRSDGTGPGGSEAEGSAPAPWELLAPVPSTLTDLAGAICFFFFFF